MNTQHTPGPWTYLRDQDGRVSIAPTDGISDGSALAYMTVRGKLNEERAIPNAALMAAAPDLLADLRQAANMLHAIARGESFKASEYIEILAGFDATCRKAEGQS